MDQTTELEFEVAACASGHWLFDPAHYAARYPDLTDAALAAAGYASLWDHYRRTGDREGRSGSLFFDPAAYRRHLTPERAADAAAEGAFAHFLRCGYSGGLRLSIYFDPDLYLRRYPEVAAAIAAGTWSCPLHHYLCNDTPTEFDPVPEFSERYYLEQNQDVAGAVAAGSVRMGYLHFVEHGVFELRAPRATVDLACYVATHEWVSADLETGCVRDAFAHYLMIGRALPAATPGRCEDVEILLPNLAQRPLDFSCNGPAALAAVLVMRTGSAATMATLVALRASFPGPIELIMVDCLAGTEALLLERFVTGGRVLRFDMDLDLAGARNAALNCVSAGSVLLLEEGVWPAPGAVGAALARLRADSGIGAVGAKLIHRDRRLREAGGIVWRDASVQLYQHDASPTAPEANFVRDVDFCSGLFLLIRTAVLHELGGFDASFGPGDDIELCLRMKQSGWRVIYDSAVVAWCDDRPSLARLPSLLRKHGRALRSRSLPAAGAQVRARDTRHRRRVLLIDDTVPLRFTGSGFVRSNELIRTMAALDVSVTVFPLTPSRFGVAGSAAELPDDVEVMTDAGIDVLEHLLCDRYAYYDTIWITRTHNLDRVAPVLERLIDRSSMLVLDTEAIASLRAAARAGIAGEPFDLELALAVEFRNAGLCRKFIAVSEAEAAVLRRIGETDVTVIGHLREVRPTPRAFGDRSGMLFLGAIHELDSPNHDALQWFVETVLPLVEHALGWEARLTVVGYTAPDVTLEQWREHPRVTLRGPVADVVPLYDAHRVFVAPARFAAGLPYKIHEAASLGLPVVTTELLQRQLDWDAELLAVEVGDAAGFAAAVVRLYRDETLWQHLRDAAAERVRAENGRARYEDAVKVVLGLG